MSAVLSEQDWNIRLYIYRFLVENGKAPDLESAAGAFGITIEEARQAFRRLSQPHQIVLEPGTETVRMAIPLSAIPTDHRVTIDGKVHYANCAWDSLGVAAMLHADAVIEAPSGEGTKPIRYSIKRGEVIAPDGLAIHFPLPIRHWFDNIINT